MDPYSILEVDQTSSEKEIKKSFREKARRLHPDANPNQTEKEAEDFKNLVAAYEVLTDPEKRLAYDKGEYNIDNHQFTISPEEVEFQDLIQFLFSPKREDAHQDNLFDFSFLKKSKRREKDPSPSVPNYRVKVRVPAKAAHDGATVAIGVDHLNLGTNKIRIKLPEESKHGDVLRAKVNGEEIFIEVLTDDLFS